MSNSRSGGGSQRHPELWYYDQLPLELKRAMQNTAYEWSARWILKRGEASSYIIKRLKEADLQEACRIHRFRRRGAKITAWQKLKSSYLETKVKPLSLTA
jgi:hypothetical protein